MNLRPIRAPLHAAETAFTLFPMRSPAAPPPVPPCPIPVLLHEAAIVAELIDHLWTSTPERPGLDTVESPQFTRAHAERLRACIAACREAKPEPLAVGAAAAELRARGRALLRELRAALRYAAHLSPELAAPYAVLRAQPTARSSGAYALASTLEDHARLAEMQGALLATLRDFDPRWIDEARALAAALRAAPGRLRAARAERKAAHLARRAHAQAIVALLSEARAAARWVYRHHPQIARAFTSAHERDKRAKTRRRRRAA